MSAHIASVCEQSLDDKEPDLLLISNSEMLLCDSPSSLSSSPLMDHMDTPNSDSDYRDPQLPDLKRTAEEYILHAYSGYDGTMGEESDTSDDSTSFSDWTEEDSEDESDGDSSLYLIPPPMLPMMSSFQCNIPSPASESRPSFHRQPSYSSGQSSSEESASDSLPPSFANHLAATIQRLCPSEPGRHKTTSQFLGKNELIPQRDVSTRSACYGPQGELIGYYPLSIDDTEPMLVKYVQRQKAPKASTVQPRHDLNASDQLASKLQDLWSPMGVHLKDVSEESSTKKYSM